MSGPTESYVAVWKRQCWKCQRLITVAMDITEWRGPHATHGGMWRQRLSPEAAGQLAHGANVQFRKTSDAPEGYFANVCTACDSVQGDWFLNEDLTRLAYEPVPRDFAALRLRGKRVVKTFNSIPELEKYRFGRYGSA